MNTVRTDLALEAREASGEIPGVTMQQETVGEMTVTRVRVVTEAGARALGKPRGNYITIEHPRLSEHETLMNREAGGAIAKELAALLGRVDSVMVVGLGNRSLTPDSLGPRVTGEILISRHILKTMPDALDERVKCVCAISPGVMGTTGVETGEVVSAVAGVVKPGCVVVVDSLAARQTSRILGTVQLTDVGVTPGSGVGNHRTALNRQTLGVPVVAIGVPMVVHAATISRDAMEQAVARIGEAAGPGSAVARVLERYQSPERMSELLQQALDEHMRGFVVTPVLIDEAVRNVSSLLAEGINRALQPELSWEEISGMIT